MTSAVAGFLQAAATPAPLQDDALEDFLGNVVAGITGILRANVRPRWQEEPGNFPARDVTWAAIGVHDQKADTFAATPLDDDGLSATLQRHETLWVLASFYGPQSGARATAFRDGLQIPQNNEQLMTAGFGLVQADGPTSAPEMIKTKWLSRADIMWIVRREIRRSYPVLSLLSAHGSIASDFADDPFDVQL